MLQFDVYENPSTRSRRLIPFVVVLQSHHYEAAPTVVVAPLILDEGRTAYTQASVRVEVSGGAYVVAIAELVAVDRQGLRRRVASLRHHEDAIRRALDRLFTGF